jgi:hypothetical protein
MATTQSVDRRRHHGPFRFMYMEFSVFLRRFLGVSAARR